MLQHVQTLPNDGDAYGSPNRAARILGISGHSVRTFIKRGKLPAIKLPDGRVLIPEKALLRFQEERECAAHPLKLAWDAVRAAKREAAP